MTSLKVGVGVLLLLLLSLPSLAVSETSDNLIEFDNWQGLTYGQDPGGCCSSISGSGALGDTNSDTILFSYGTDILYQTIAIQQALQSSGISVDGYQYGWTYRLVSNNGRGGDILEFEVTVKDANGNEVERQTYNRSGGAYDQWVTEQGANYFVSPYLDPQNIQMKITGRDGGFWGGYYGPEVKDVDLRLIYSADPCAADPLYDPSCSGYAEAYAQYLYDQQCATDPLYDSGCPGYSTAYYNQQCTIYPLYDSGCPGYHTAYYDQQCSLDPLYDQGCTGYAQAYYDQQCSLDPLYDSGCTGYAQAYLDQQCGLDPLYDTQCSGYAQAYYNQQCGLDPLYDRGCEGYGEAYAQKYILIEDTTTTDSTQTISSASETAVPITDPEEIAMPSATGDATVDSILKDLTDVPTTTVIMETSTVEAISSVQETTEPETQTETTEQTDSAGEMEELVAEVENVSESSGDVEEQDSEGESDGESESSESDSDSKGKDEGKKDSKREKLKKAIAKKATQLANQMSQAASLEAQQAAQATVLALINYVPDFNTYQRQMNGGYLPDAVGYADTQVPESRRGLRNGLAQQLLHEKMVEMQYENLTSK